MISICEVSESKTSLAIAANAKINVDTNFWIKISSLSATLPSLIGDMMMGSWSDIFGKKRMAIMWCFFKIYICFLWFLLHQFNAFSWKKYSYIPGRRLPLFLPSVGGLLATAIYLRWPHFILFKPFHSIYSGLSHYQVHEEVMARWQDGIGDSHQPAFSCDHDFF